MNNERFYVISNGCDVKPKVRTKDIRKQYNIPQDSFVFVFVGNVGIRKNQKQVVDAYELLDDNSKSQIYVLFVGGGQYENLKTYILSKHAQSHLIVCGMVPKEDVHNYYYASNATILTSVSEGFGLSIIEGMAYGLPSLTFKDLPAIKDLYDDSAMLALNDRSTNSLSEGIKKASTKKWNRSEIVTHAQKFSFEKMADAYITTYIELL